MHRRKLPLTRADHVAVLLHAGLPFCITLPACRAHARSPPNAHPRRAQGAVLPAIMQQPLLTVASVARNRMGGELLEAADALRARATPSQLLRFDASENHFTGPVPAELKGLGAFQASAAGGAGAAALRYVRFASNDLQGDVPSELYSIDFPGRVEVRCGRAACLARRAAA